MLSIPLDERNITDEEVFDAFDLSYPGLEAVKRSLEEQNLHDAKKHLIAYLEKRTTPQFLFDYRTLPLTPIDTDSCPYSFQSSLGLSGSLKDFCLYVARKMMDEHVYVLPGKGRAEIPLGKNWESMVHFNFYEDMGKMHRSRLDMMVRGQFFESLCVLYHETGDPKVLDAFEEILQVFLKTYPLVITHSQPSTDRFMYTEDRDVMSVGWLTVVYTSLFYTRVPYEISTDLAFEIVKRIWFLGIQFRRFDTDTYRPYNHHMWERGLVPFILGTMFPEIPDFTAMKQRGAEIVCRHVKEDFNTAGGYSEHSIAYWSGAAVGEMLYRGIYLARLNNETLLDEETAQRMNQTFHVLAMLCPPTDRYPSLGDNGGPMLEPILGLGVRTMEHEECQKILDIRSGIAPDQDVCLDFCDDRAGFVCAKNGYGPDSNYMMMSAKVDCGYSGHNHMDMLSLCLTMRGQDIIGEPYTGHLYHNIRMKSELRGYMYNMVSHNTVLAYGQPIMPNSMYANKWGVLRTPTPITASWSNSDGLYASAYHDGYTFCRHTRDVLFSRDHGLIVSDHILRGNRLDNPHIQRWHLMPGASVTVTGPHSAVVEKGGVHLLFVWAGAEHEITITKPEILVPEMVARTEDLTEIIDVSFQASEAEKGRNVTDHLHLLILDVTEAVENGKAEISAAQTEELARQLQEVCGHLHTDEALKQFPHL